MSIKQTVIDKAVQNLTTIGVLFKILDGDNVYTNITEPEKKKIVRVRTVPQGTYAKIYKPHMNSMAVDDVAIIPIPDGVNVKALQYAISAAACYKWGNGSSISEIDGSNIILLRKK